MHLPPGRYGLKACLRGPRVLIVCGGAWGGPMRYLIAATMLAWMLAGPAAAKSRGCDRACLEGLVGQYLTALQAHDPARAPLARTARFTENAQPLRLGEGSWVT